MFKGSLGKRLGFFIPMRPISWIIKCSQLSFLPRKCWPLTLRDASLPQKLCFTPSSPRTATLVPSQTLSHMGALRMNETNICTLFFYLELTFYKFYTSLKLNVPLWFLLWTMRFLLWPMTLPLNSDGWKHTAITSITAKTDRRPVCPLPPHPHRSWRYTFLISTTKTKLLFVVF